MIDLVDDEDPGPQTSDLQLTMRDLKKRKIITHPIVIVIDHHFIDLTLALANIQFYCDHRLTSFRHLDLQEASKLTLKFLEIF